ncbi:MAG: hypothetical protein IPP03_02520 [Dechloromonas sp.]|nr:hypothetical protein [Candidatus Dechloromonas phosphoritropha]
MEKTGYISEVIILTGDAMVRSYGRKHIRRQVESITEGTMPLDLRLPVCHGRPGGIKPCNGKVANRD